MRWAQGQAAWGVTIPGLQPPGLWLWDFPLTSLGPGAVEGGGSQAAATASSAACTAPHLASPALTGDGYSRDRKSVV